MSAFYDGQFDVLLATASSNPVSTCRRPTPW